MTKDDFFYNSVKDDVISVYGIGLQQEKALAVELAEVQERLRRLRIAASRDNEPEDSKRRIARAIIEHEKRKAEVLELIDAAGKA